MSSRTSPDRLLLFTPVPQHRVRAGGWSADMQRAFIDALSRSASVAAAARSVGKTARSAYYLRDRDGAGPFAAAWDQALERARDAALAAARDHLLNPERVPVVYRGRIIGWRTRTNDRVLINALRAIHSQRHAPSPPPARPVPHGTPREPRNMLWRREAIAADAPSGKLSAGQMRKRPPRPPRPERLEPRVRRL